jgi:hypothetical protein
MKKRNLIRKSIQRQEVYLSQMELEQKKKKLLTLTQYLSNLALNIISNMDQEVNLEEHAVDS